MVKRLLGAAGAAVILTACQGAGWASTPAPLAPSSAHLTAAPDQYPPACTAKKLKNGAKVTSISAFGTLSPSGTFSLAKPSSWTQVTWYSGLPPNKRRSTAAPGNPSATMTYVYWGTYTVSDGTQGCLYVVVPISSAAASPQVSVSAIPRIPDTGATLPRDFGTVGSMTLHVRGRSGTGNAALVHLDGSHALTAKFTIEGRVQIHN